ncbi:hypothetical protein QUC31_001039 [Theobroma cacao]
MCCGFRKMTPSKQHIADNAKKLEKENDGLIITNRMEPQQEADNICQGNNVEKMQFGGIGQGGFAKEDEMVGWDMMIVMGLGITITFQRR